MYKCVSFLSTKSCTTSDYKSFHCWLSLETVTTTISLSTYSFCFLLSSCFWHPLCCIILIYLNSFSIQSAVSKGVSKNSKWICCLCGKVWKRGKTQIFWFMWILSETARVARWATLHHFAMERFIPPFQVCPLSNLPTLFIVVLFHSETKIPTIFFQ